METVSSPSCVLAVFRFLNAPFRFFLAALLLLCLSNLTGLINPPAAFEDGREILAFFHENPSFSSIFRFYAGYVSFGPNLIGWLLNFLPLDLRPLLYVCTALVIGAASFSMLAARSVTIVGLPQEAKVAIGLAMLFLPLGNMAIYQMLMFSLWHMLIFASILVLFWTPQNKRSAALLFIPFVLSLVSHPASICLIPFMLWRIVQSQGAERLFWGSSTVVLVVYLIVGVQGDGSGEVGVPKVATLLTLMADRVVFETFFGTYVRMQLNWRDLQFVMGLVSVLFLLVLMAGLGRLVQRQSSVAFQVGAAFGLCLGYLLFSATVRDLSPLTVFEHRYFYPSQFLFLVLLSWALCGLCAGRDLSWVGRRTGLFLGCVVALWLSGVMILHHRYLVFDPALGHSLRHSISVYKQMAAEGRAPCVILERNNGWSVHLHEQTGSAAACVTIQGNS